MTKERVGPRVGNHRDFDILRLNLMIEFFVHSDGDIYSCLNRNIYDNKELANYQS